MSDARDGVRQALLALAGIDAAMSLGAKWTAIEDIREAVIESLREDAVALLAELDEKEKGDAEPAADSGAGGEAPVEEGAAEARRAADRGEEG